jgi:hypothetical protein
MIFLSREQFRDRLILSLFSAVILFGTACSSETDGPSDSTDAESQTGMSETDSVSEQPDDINPSTDLETTGRPDGTVDAEGGTETSETETVAPVSKRCWFEAEDIGSVAEDWEISSEISGFNGSGYLAYTEGQSWSPGEKMTYTIHIPEKDEYWIQLRGRRDKDSYKCGTDVENDKCNDLWSKVADGSWYKTMVKWDRFGDEYRNQGWARWIWDGKVIDRGDERPIYELNAGEVSFSISGRSPGVKLDAIAVFPEGAERPGPDARDCTTPIAAGD